MVRLLAPTALLFLVGCFGPPEEVDFGDPDLLGPLASENRAPEVPGEDGDPFPEALTVVSGHDDEADHYWAHARAWVHADSAAVWASLREIDVVVDRRAVDEYALVEENPMPEFDFSYVISNRVQDILSVDYELTWVHELQEGEIDTPEQVVVRWDKTDGTPFIDLLGGSIVLHRIDGGLTEIELIEHMRAAARDEETLEVYLADLYADLLAHVHGDPLPTFE